MIILLACAQSPSPPPAVAFPSEPGRVLLARHDELLSDLRLSASNRPTPPPDADEAILPPGSDVEAFREAHGQAVVRERALSLDLSGLDDRSFVHRTALLGDARRTGLYLPAPSSATWDVVVPERARLRLEAGLLEPSFPADKSGGSWLVVEVSSEAGTAEVAVRDLRPGPPLSLEADLSAWQGQRVRLRLRTEAGPSPDFDYVFVAEPLVYTPSEAPRHTVLVFVDTLRADRLGTMGYERDTTPAIDAWARSGAVFEAVQSAAPWTLPSMRGALSGRLPDLWDQGAHLPDLLARGGVESVALVTNPFMSSAFAMDEGWSTHIYARERPAEGQVVAALEELAARPDRDAVVMLQLVDVHLPYARPSAPRWAGERPKGLPEPFRRSDLLTRRAVAPDPQALDRYVSDRYDEALRDLDDALAPLLAAVGPNDVVVLFGDHGEELGDHGGLEHGHALYQELLHVPVILAGPGVPAGRVASPVSLLDLSPTVLELMDVEVPPGLVGRSLLPLARGEGDVERALPFGYVLHDLDGWGALEGTTKWVLHGEATGTYDLAADPDEHDPTPLVDETMIAGALDRPVADVWRFTTPFDLEVRPKTVTFTGPIERLWLGIEPYPVAPARVQVEADRAVVSEGHGLNARFPREVFVLTPSGEAPGLVVDGQPVRATSAPGWSLGRVRAPVPPAASGVASMVMGAETIEALKALGYTE